VILHIEMNNYTGRRENDFNVHSFTPTTGLVVVVASCSSHQQRLPLGGVLDIIGLAGFHAVGVVIAVAFVLSARAIRALALKLPHLPFWDVKRPERPYKSAMKNRFNIENR
jgi:hypothetical protein